MDCSPHRQQGPVTPLTPVSLLDARAAAAELCPLLWGDSPHTVRQAVGARVMTGVRHFAVYLCVRMNHWVPGQRDEM